MNVAAKKHAVQDVRAPLYFLVTLCSQLSNDVANLAPFMMQILFMHLDIQVDPTKFVKADNIIGGVVEKNPNGPHDIKTVCWLLDTCPYFHKVEDYPLPEQLRPDGGRDYLNQRSGSNPILHQAVQVPWEGRSASTYDYVRVVDNPVGWCPFCAQPLKGKAKDHGR